MEWTSIDGNVNYYESVHYPIPNSVCGNREHPAGNFQNKSVRSPLYSLLGQTEGERKAFFGGCKKGRHIMKLHPRALGCHNK